MVNPWPGHVAKDPGSTMAPEETGLDELLPRKTNLILISHFCFTKVSSGFEM